MAYTTIDDPSAHFNTILYTGNVTARSITGVGFQPDWIWFKKRSSPAQNHTVYDSSRGTNKILFPDVTDAESTNSSQVTSFDSDGFSLGTGTLTNYNTGTYVAWNWKANGGTTSSNTDGSITSTVQANTTAGFSIVTYSGNGSTGTVGHGLGAVPKLYIVKRRNGSGWSWYTYSVHKGAGHTLYLNSTSAGDSDTTVWQNTSPTSSVFYVGARDGVNGSDGNMVAYCFADIQGYSKFGSYTGNGSTDGTFGYTGFKPAFVLFKQTSGTEWWGIIDATRDPVNQGDKYLKANDNVAEGTGLNFDLLSNGIKFRHADAAFNGSGSTYIYMAFAEHPFVSSKGVPVTAR